MTVGIILAAGRSARFGAANKLLAPFRGKPLARHAAEAMRSLPLTRCVAVLQDDALLPVFEGFDIVRPPPGSGQADSVVAGVGQAVSLGASKVLIALADMPLVTAAHLRAVLDLCDDIHGSATTGPLPPVAFPASRFAELLALTGDRGAGALLRDLSGERLVPVPPGVAVDVDTTADLDRLAGMFT